MSIILVFYKQGAPIEPKSHLLRLQYKQYVPVEPQDELDIGFL